MEISDFIFDLLHRRVRKILLEKEIKYLPDIFAVNKSWQPLCDLIFVIERFKSLKILPYNYDITYSSIFNDLSLSEKKRDNLNRLKKLLINGDSKINNASSGFLPKSSKSYLTNYYGTTGRYNVDFTNQFFGIKHFHLDSHNRGEDVLLYYVLHKNKILKSTT